MKAQQLVELRRHLDEVTTAREEYLNAANASYEYQKSGPRIAHVQGRLMDVAAARAGTLMNMYNSLFTFLEEHRDELLNAGQPRKGGKKR
jgi:hypothetical protein